MAIQKTAPVGADNKNSDSGLIGFFVKLFMGGEDPDREKRRLVKQLGKDLLKVKYKFYKPKGSEASPGLAKFFYECYKNSANAGVILQGADKSNALRSICIEHFLSPEQERVLDHFNDGYIRERAKAVDSKTLAAELKDDLVLFFSSFNSKTVAHINGVYTLIMRFLSFVVFDFYFILKKFDSGMLERNFVANPKFEAIPGDYVLDDIKDFQEISLGLDRQADWNAVFDVLKIFKSVDPVDRVEWNRIINIVHQVNSSDILSMVVQHISSDPWYKPSIDKQNHRIVESYIEKIKTQVESTIQSIASERKDAQIDKLMVMVFGTKDIQRTKNYTENANLMFSKKQTQGYTYVVPINLMKAFLVDYFKKDVRELQELILVRGKWTTNVMSQQISDLYYQILSLSEQIIAFDESCADEADVGSKIRKTMARVVDRDTSSGNSLRQILEEVNERAAKMVSEAASALIALGKYLRIVLEDIDKKNHEVMLNWKELENISDVPLKTRISEIYKKLYFFIQLIQLFSRGAAAPSRTPSVATIDTGVPDEG